MGEQSTTCVFGVILALVCPIMFGVQNFLLGICLFEDSSKNLSQGFCHVLQSMRYQMVVLYDLSLFRGDKKDNKSSWPGVVRIVVGYILYVLPICGLVTLFIFAHAKLTLCRSPKATFLLDNDVVPAVSMSSLYQARQLFAEEVIKKNPAWEFNSLKYQDGNGLLEWNYDTRSDRHWKPYRKFNYWPLENITDLIEQYNYVGFHDMCIYPRIYSDQSNIGRTWNSATKGVYRLAHGYAQTNSSGADYNK